MVWTILLIILFILCVLLLLPVCVKAYFDDGKWGVEVRYTFFRIFRKESKEPKPPDTPPKPGDLPEGESPPQDLMPEPATAAEAAKPDPPKPEPAKPEAVKPPVSETVKPPAENSAPEPAAAIASEKPEKPKKKKRKKPKADDTAPESEKPKKPKKRGFIARLKPHSVEEALGLAEDAFSALTPALAFLTRHIHLRHVKIYAAVGTDDAAMTAQLYGKICAAAYNLLGQLQCWLDIQTDEFRILADFYNDSITFRGSLELRVSPAAAIVLALILGTKFLWRTLCRFRREDKEAKRRAEESAPVSSETATRTSI